MPQAVLMSEADIDHIMNWQVMQKFMDELSETEDDSGSSDDVVGQRLD